MSAPNSERRLSVTRAGKLFLATIVFILIPAYALAVNLMFLMAALFIGIFIYNGILAFLNLRKLSVRFENVPDLFADRPATIDLHLTNRKKVLSAGYLTLNLKSPNFAFREQKVRQLARGQECTRTVAATPAARGWAAIRGCNIETGYPFGLVLCRVFIPMKQKVLVYPAIQDHLPPILQVEHLDKGLLPKSSGDYQYLTSYSYGEDVRLIHWKKSTLLENPVLKKDLVRSEVVEPRLFIPDPCPNFEYAISAMATYFLEMPTLHGWEVLKRTGIEEIESKEAMLEYLALVRPLDDGQGYDGFDTTETEALYASQITPSLRT